MLPGIANTSEKSFWFIRSPFPVTETTKSETALGVLGRIVSRYWRSLSLFPPFVCEKKSNQLFVYGHNNLSNRNVPIASKSLEPHRSLAFLDVVSFSCVRSVAGPGLCSEQMGDWSGFCSGIHILFDRFWLLCQNWLCFLVHLKKNKKKPVFNIIVNKRVTCWLRKEVVFYWHELHILEEFLYEASGRQPIHTVRQEMRNLGIQADVIKGIGKLFLYPKTNRENQLFNQSVNVRIPKTLQWLFLLKEKQYLRK